MKNDYRRKNIRCVSVLTAAVLFLGLTGCGLFDNPGAPSWDLPLMISLNSTTYSLDSLITNAEDFAQDSSGIVVDSLTGELGFEFLSSIETTYMEELQFVPEEYQYYLVTLDTISFVSDDTLNGVTTIADLIPGFVGDGTYPVDTLVIPESSQDVQLSEMDSLEVIHIVDPNGGTMFLELENNTNLTWTRITCTIIIDDEANGYPVIDSVHYDNLGPFQAQTQSIDMSGDSLKPNLIVRSVGYGPNQGLVELNSDDNLTYNVWVTEISADYAIASMTTQQSMVDSSALELDQDDWIVEALISNGRMIYNVINEFDMEVEVDVIFPDVRNINTGEVLHETILLGYVDNPDVAWSHQDTIDISNHILSLPLPETTDDKQVLRSSTIMTLLTSGESNGEPRSTRITIEDTLQTSFRIDTLTFDYITAIPKGYDIELEPETQTIEIWENQSDLQEDFIGTLLLESAYLQAELQNSFEVPAKVEFDIIARNNRVTPPDELTVSYNRWIYPSQDTLTFGHIEELVNIMPDELTIAGTVFIGRDYLVDSPFDPYEPYTISSSDSISGEITLTAPLAFSIIDTIAVRPRPITVDPFDGVEDINHVKVVTNVSNALPLSGTVYFLAGVFDSEEEARVGLRYPNREQYMIMEPFAINGPEIDPNTGRAIAPSVNSDTLTMTNERMMIFSQPNVYTRQILRLYPTFGTDGEITSYAANRRDSLTVFITAELDYHLNLSDEEGN